MDANSPTLAITLKIGTRQLPMTVRREEEIYYRDAEKMINGRYSYYANKYPGQGSEMYLVMVALDISVRLCHKEAETDSAPLLNAMGSMIQEIEESLIKK